MKNIYINVNPDNKDCPDDVKKECPNDADLIMVTDGHADNVRSTPALMMHGKIATRKIVCNSEIGVAHEIAHKIKNDFMAKMQRGGTKDFDFCKVTMVRADNSSSLLIPTQ